MLAAALGVRLRAGLTSLTAMSLVVVLGGALFSTFSFVIACLVKTRERFMGEGQVLTMPLFFASNAVYPLSMMPPWLRAISGFNPLTYLVNALREIMIEGGRGAGGIASDVLVLLAVFLALEGIAAKLYGAWGTSSWPSTHSTPASPSAHPRATSSSRDSSRSRSWRRQVPFPRPQRHPPVAGVVGACAIR